VGPAPPPPVALPSAVLDVRVCCNDGVVGCSGLLLAAASPLMKQLLCEAGQPGEIKTLILPDISKGDIMLFLR